MKEKLKKILLEWNTKKFVIFASSFVILSLIATSIVVIKNGGLENVQSKKETARLDYQKKKQSQSTEKFYGYPSAEEIANDYFKKYKVEIRDDDKSDERLEKMYGKENAQLIDEGENWSDSMTSEESSTGKYNIEYARQNNLGNDKSGYLLGNADLIETVSVLPEESPNISYNQKSVAGGFGTNILALEGTSGESVYWESYGSLDVTSLLSPNRNEMLLIVKFTKDVPKDKANKEVEKFLKKSFKLGENKFKPSVTDLESVYKVADKSFSKKLQDYYKKQSTVMEGATYVFNLQGKKTDADKFYIDETPISQFVNVDNKTF